MSDLILTIKVSLRAPATKILSFENETLKIALKSLPIENKANLELIDFLAKIFKKPKKDIIFKSGLKSRTKIIAVKDESRETLEKIISKLPPTDIQLSLLG